MFLTVLEGRFRPRVLLGSVPGREALFLACSSRLLAVPSHGGERPSLSCLFHKGANPLSGSKLEYQSLPTDPPLNITALGIRASTHGFRRHRRSVLGRVQCGTCSNSYANLAHQNPYLHLDGTLGEWWPPLAPSSHVTSFHRPVWGAWGRAGWPGWSLPHASGGRDPASPHPVTGIFLVCFPLRSLRWPPHNGATVAWGSLPGLGVQGRPYRIPLGS